jgi:uncharacterized protein YbjT (DUF2867 family)
MNNQGSTRKALLLGASGLVGSFCLKELASNPLYKEIYAPSRTKLDFQSEKVINPVLNFDEVNKDHEMFAVDDVYCCLGTTIAKAKSKEAFTRIDYELVITLSHLAHCAGARRLAFISSIGASETGSFYLKTKALAESGLIELGFEGLHLIRPSLLLGDRKEKRMLEKLSIDIFSKTSFLFKGFLSRWKPVHAQDVARFMVTCLTQKKDGNFIHESNTII